MGIEGLAADLDVEVDLVRAIAERHVRSRMRRSPALTPETVRSDRYDTFHELELQFD